MPRPRPRPVVLLIDPANRLDPLLVDHPPLSDVLLLPVSGVPRAVLADVAILQMRAHQPAAVVLDFLPPYEASWALVVRLREADSEARWPIIFTTDNPTAMTVLPGVPFGVAQLALVVQPDGAGVAELVERICAAVQQREARGE
jgi:DNA-binding response OmpR family regulator